MDRALTDTWLLRFLGVVMIKCKEICHLFSTMHI